jgi:preprotein translocase subunit SecE
VGARAARPAVAGSGSGAGRGSLVEYFRGVWDELKKVVWPTRDELWRMTGIVLATVVLFAVFIGGVDYVLSLGVKQVYTSTSSSTTRNTTRTTPTLPSVTSAANTAPSGAPRVTPLP